MVIDLENNVRLASSNRILTSSSQDFFTKLLCETDCGSRCGDLSFMIGLHHRAIYSLFLMITIPQTSFKNNGALRNYLFKTLYYRYIKTPITVDKHANEFTIASRRDYSCICYLKKMVRVYSSAHDMIMGCHLTCFNVL